MSSSAAKKVCIRAPAKINLGLAVLGRRPDGYHEIATLFQAVDLFDSIALRRIGKRSIRLVTSGFSGREKENLAYRAGEIFLRETGVSSGLEIRLTKRIPVGGGLGGGSSDAAAVLLGACRLHGLSPAMADLENWARRLGSDVPFFLHAGTAVGSGRGDVIKSLDGAGPGCAALLYAPGFESLTPSIYGALDPARLTPSRRRLTMLVNCWKRGDAGALGTRMFNDLEEPVLRRHGSLKQAKKAFLASGALGAMVSGSGSSLFALYPDAAAASAAARGLRPCLPGSIRKVMFLSRRHHWGVVKR